MRSGVDTRPVRAQSRATGSQWNLSPTFGPMTLPTKLFGTMRMPRNFWLGLAAVAGPLVSGCGTIISHADGQGGVYSGVSADARLVATVGNETHDIPVVPWAIPFSIFDMPLSAVADTLCLPVVLVKGSSSSATHAPLSPEAKR